MCLYAKIVRPRERIFFIRPQALVASSKNALAYDGWSSEPIIYAYVGGRPIQYADPTGLFGIDGAIGGGIVGAFTGGLGARLAGGNGWDVWSGAVSGAFSGALAGALGGGLTGAVAGGVGDLAGQILANRNNGKPLSCINVGEVVGATAGGFIGGKGGDALTKALINAGANGERAAVIGGLLSSGPSLGLGLIGNALSGP